MAVTDEEFHAVSTEVERLAVRVRTLEDDRAIDRAEAEVRHRALVDSLQALRLTQIDHGREVVRLREDVVHLGEDVVHLGEDVVHLGEDVVHLREDVVQLRGDMENGFATVTETLSHVVRLLGDERT